MRINQPRSGDILPVTGLPPAKAGGWQNVAATRLKTPLAVLLFVALFTVLVSAQSTQLDVSGAWAVTLEAPRGDVDFRMWIVQKGSKLTGYMLSEVGQFDMEGSITGNQIKFSWSFPDGGQMVPISCQGKVEGNFISGTAKVGNLGEGPMNAERR